MTCETCGVKLPPKAATGIPRKYCSERCRYAQYGGTCVDCGGPTRGYHGPGTRSKRCLSCHGVAAGVVASARQKARAEPGRKRIVELWAAGFSLREIAAEIGTTKKSIGVTMVHMRKAGWDLPYRYKAYEKRDR